jgi:hypothetical protein
MKQLDLFADVMAEVMEPVVIAQPQPEPELVAVAQPQPEVEFLEPTIESMLGEDFMGAVNGLFKLMEYAEDEIAKAQEQHAEHADLIWHTFCILGPGSYPFDKRLPALYRSHCRELIARATQGEDMAAPTIAELLIGVMHFFTFAAPGHAGACVATYLYKHAMIDNEKAMAALEQYDPKEPWEGFNVEQVSTLRRASRLQNNERRELWAERLKEVQAA